MSQCQGQMWVTGRAWVDQVFYNPAFPSAVIRYERDEDYITDLAAAVLMFNDRLDAAERTFRERYTTAAAGPRTGPTEATDGPAGLHFSSGRASA